jgi:DivIVA domain-containing protein
MPTDVHNVAFSPPPIGKPGYHKDEVDNFLELVKAELARLIEENNNLRDRLEPLRPQQRARSVLAPTPPRIREQILPGDDHNIHVAKVLGLAHEMADRLTGEAKAEAKGILSEARTTSEQLLCEAGPKANRMVNEARSQAETMLNDARIAAETLDRQSRNAASLERDAARKHTEITQIIAALREEKSTLEKKIEDLRIFEFEYRIRLKTYLESQLEELDGRRPATPTDARRTSIAISAPCRPQ